MIKGCTISTSTGKKSQMDLDGFNLVEGLWESQSFDNFDRWKTPELTNVTMEKTTMNEDVSPIKSGDFALSC